MLPLLWVWGGPFWFRSFKITTIWVPKAMVSVHGLEGLGFRARKPPSFRNPVNLLHDGDGTYSNRVMEQNSNIGRLGFVG